MVTVRPWRLDDIEMLLEWVHTAPEILEGFQLGGATDLQLRSWMLTAEMDPKQQWFVVERDGDPLGIVGMNPIEGNHAVCHQLRSPHQKGLKVALHAARAGIQYVMDNYPHLERLVAFVPKDNVAALRLDARLGFQDIGVRTLVYQRSNNDNGNGASDQARLG